MGWLQDNGNKLFQNINRNQHNALKMLISPCLCMCGLLQDILKENVNVHRRPGFLRDQRAWPRIRYSEVQNLSSHEINGKKIDDE